MTKATQEQGLEAPKKVVRRKIMSRLNYALELKYNSDTIMLAPFGVEENLDPDLLESELPAGVQYVDYEV